ncbi:MAG: DMT family transporter [Gammaproteobacteria bacterium]
MNAPSQEPADTPNTLPNPLLGMILMVAAMFVVPFIDGIAKYLSTSYPLVQVVWARYFFHLLLMLPLTLYYHGARSLRPAATPLQLLRGLFLLGSTGFFFAALAYMPIADALSLIFISPFVVTVLSALFLGESVGPRRWTAVIIGFLGALIIIRPGLGVFSWASVLAICAGLCYALYIVTTRQLANTGTPPLISLTATGVIGVLVTSCLLPFGWHTPTLTDLLWMTAMGMIAASGHFLITKSLQHAPAAQLAPLSYSEIVMATLIGYVVFGDFPDRWTWLGMAVIVSSGIYISWRERRHLRKLA